MTNLNRFFSARFSKKGNVAKTRIMHRNFVMSVETTIKYGFLTWMHSHHYGDKSKSSGAIYFEVVSARNRFSNVKSGLNSAIKKKFDLFMRHFNFKQYQFILLNCNHNKIKIETTYRIFSLYQKQKLFLFRTNGNAVHNSITINKYFHLCSKQLLLKMNSKV